MGYLSLKNKTKHLFPILGGGGPQVCRTLFLPQIHTRDHIPPVQPLWCLPCFKMAVKIPIFISRRFDFEPYSKTNYFSEGVFNKYVIWVWFWERKIFSHPNCLAIACKRRE